MDIKTRLSGLDELLAVIYGNDMHLSMLLRELGFEQSQVAQLQNGYLESVVSQFLEVIHKRLTSDSGKDTYYHILSRRYGLFFAKVPNGEPGLYLMDHASFVYLIGPDGRYIEHFESDVTATDLVKALRRHVMVAATGNN